METQAAKQGHNGRSDEHRQDGVAVMINGVEYTIHRGRQMVNKLKRIAGVPQADELVQIVDGKLVPLNDSDGVTIKGHEQFVSQPRDSGSS